MQTPLHITIRDLARSEALETRIRDTAAKLERVHPRLMSVNVTIEQQNRHQHQGRQFAVRVGARVPGRVIAVDRAHDEDVYVALRDAFEATLRQLEEAWRIERGEVKTRAA